MSVDVDELFGAEGAPKPRTALAVTLLVGGLVLSVAGLACTSVPGGLMVLWAWFVVDKESHRLDSGYLAADAKDRVRTLELMVNVGLLVVLVVFATQTFSCLLASKSV